MEMKEMVYKDLSMAKFRKREVLFSGVYEGRKFSIVSLESHPVAYVSMKETEPEDYDNKYYWEVDVHGGFTYCGKSYWDDDKENMYLGWDYAHAGDCWGAFSKYGIGGKQWTTEEIYEEVKNVVIQLNIKENEIMKKDLEYWNKCNLGCHFHYSKDGFAEKITVSEDLLKETLDNKELKDFLSRFIASNMCRRV